MGKKTHFIHEIAGLREWSCKRRLLVQKLQSPECLAALAAFLVDVGREGFGHKQMSTGLMSSRGADNRDMSGGFDR